MHGTVEYLVSDVLVGKPGMTAAEINQNARTNPTGPAGPQGHLRRSLGGAYCGVCGVTKYISPHRKNVGKLGPKRCSPGSEPPSTKFKIKTENGVVETSEKIVQINQYPKVTLCDIAKKCGTCSHNCSLLLPDAVKRKTIHCFKLDLSGGFWFWPCCLGHNAHENEKRGKCCANVPDEMNICCHLSLSRHKENLEEVTDSQPQSTGNAQRFCNSWANGDSAACSASILIRKHLHKGDDMRGSDAEEEPGPGSENHRDKRAKLEESGECSSTCRSPVKENCMSKKPCDQRGDPTETNATHMSPEPLCDSSSDKDDMDTADPESFTCQRVKVYVRKMRYSCARTYMPWPFLKGHLAGKAHDTSTASSAGCIDPSVPDSDLVTSNQIPTCSSSKHIQNMVPDASLEKREEDSKSVFVKKNGKGHSNLSESDRTNMVVTAQTVHTEESVASLHSDMVSFSIPSQHAREPGVDMVSNSPFACKGPEIDSSASTPSPSVLGLSDSETASAFSSIPDPYSTGVSGSLSTTPPSHPPSPFLPREIKDVELKSVDKILYCEETHLLSDSSLSPTPPNTSPFLLQDVWENEFLPQRSPTYYNLSPFKRECPLLRNINEEQCVMIDSNEFMLPPVLSPVTSPLRHLWRRSFSCQRTSVPHEEEQEEINKDVNKSKTLPEFGCTENSNDLHEHNAEEVDGVSIDLKSLDDGDGSPVKTQSFPSTDEDMGDCTEEESISETNYEQGREYSNKNFLDPEIKATLGSPVLSEARSCGSSNKDNDSSFSDEGEQDSGKDEAPSPSKLTDMGGDKTKAGAAGASQPSILDEFAAYEQDILLVDVNQDDSELFDNLPEQSLLRLGPVRVAKAPKRKPTVVVKMLSSNGASVQFEQRLTPVKTNFHCDSPDITEESDSRPWRPRSGSNPTTIQNTCPATSEEPRHVGQFDANNNHVEGGLRSNRSQLAQMASSPHSILPLTSLGNGPRMKNSTVVTDFRHQKSNAVDDGLPRWTYIGNSCQTAVKCKLST